MGKGSSRRLYEAFGGHSAQGPFFHLGPTCFGNESCEDAPLVADQEFFASLHRQQELRQLLGDVLRLDDLHGYTLWFRTPKPITRVLCHPKHLKRVVGRLACI